MPTRQPGTAVHPFIKYSTLRHLHHQHHCFRSSPKAFPYECHRHSCKLECLTGTIPVNLLASVNLSFCQVWVWGGKIDLYIIYMYIFQSAVCPIHRGLSEHCFLSYR